MASFSIAIKTTRLLLLSALVGFLFFIPLAKVFSMHTSYFDLGVFENTLYQSAVAGEWQLAFAGHAHWFALIYGLLGSLFSFAAIPYFLVGTQAILLSLPTYFLYRRFGMFIAFTYITFYPVWVNVHFDFHYDHLSVPLLLVFYLTLLNQKIGWAVISATLLIFIKEPFALQTAACGVLLLWCFFRSSSIWTKPIDFCNRVLLIVGALWLVSVGLGYFYFAMVYFLPYFSPVGWLGPLGGEAFGWLGHSFSEIMQMIITKPHSIVWDIVITPGKLVYLGIVFGMLAFIPLLYPAFLIPAAPLLAIAMLSHLPNHYDYNAHYTAGLIIPVIFAFVYGLPRAESIWGVFIGWLGGMLSRIKASLDCKESIVQKIDLQKKISMVFVSTPANGFCKLQNGYWLFYVFLFGWILLGHIALSPSPISRLFWLDKVWSYSWHAYVPTERVAMMKAAMEKFIPDDPEISITTQNTLNYSFLAHRKLYLSFPLGISEPSKVMNWSNRTWEGLVEFVRTGYKSPSITLDRYADYVVLDLRRPYFLVDHGCEWIYDDCLNKEMEKKFLDWVAYTKSYYEMVFEQDEFIILKRRRL